MVPLHGFMVAPQNSSTRPAARQGHSSDVLCLAYSPAAKLAASGQGDPPGPEKPHVAVWEPSTGTTVRVDGVMVPI